MTLNVLIADDERWMRDTIAKSIDWDEYGFRILGKASDGLQAYEMILEQKPDIVLADIKMPGMDGITLLKRLKENGVETVFIFFSGYDKFEYAKDAINLGAMGYLLKPVDENELLTMLLKAKKYIEFEKQSREGKIQLVDLSERELDRKKAEVIRRLFEGSEFYDNTPQSIGIELVSDYFLVISLEIEGRVEIDNGDALKKTAQGTLALNTMCLDYFERAGMKTFVLNAQMGVEVLLNLKNFHEGSNQQKIIDTCEEIINTFRINIGQLVSIGIGYEVNGKQYIRESHRASLKALEQKLILGMGRVIDYKNVCINNINTVILDSTMEKKIIESFEKSDFTIADEIIEVVKTLMKSTVICVDDIKSFNYSLIELIYRLMNKSGIQTEKYCRNPHLLCDELNRCIDMVELFKEYQKLINESIQLVSDRKLNYYKKLADSVKKYIHEHYREDLSLESVATELSFHPNYISKIFKNEFKETFIDYVTNYRIELSKDLLKDIRNNVFDVADMVGYRNPKYFSKVFKKITGVTPVEYIRKK